MKKRETAAAPYALRERRVGTPPADPGDPPPRQLRILHAELKDYGQRLTDLTPAIERFDRAAARQERKELAELGYIRVFVSSMLEVEPCRSCTDCEPHECPAVRLWRRTRDRIQRLESRVAGRHGPATPALGIGAPARAGPRRSAAEPEPSHGRRSSKDTGSVPRR